MWTYNQTEDMYTQEIYNNTDELYHYGVLGMRWGIRRAMGNYGRRLIRMHGGPSIRIGTKRQLAADKSDLKYLKKGGHLSIGFTKKRQAQYDARDRRLLENRIRKNQKKLSRISNDHKEASRLRKKKLSEMSNEEIKTLNKRRQLETDYKRLNKGSIATGLAIAGGTAAALGTYASIKNNGGMLISDGKKAVEFVKNLKIK